MLSAALSHGKNGLERKKTEGTTFLPLTKALMGDPAHDNN